MKFVLVIKRRVWGREIVGGGWEGVGGEEGNEVSLMNSKWDYQEKFGAASFASAPGLSLQTRAEDKFKFWLLILTRRVNFEEKYFLHP